MKQGWVLMTKSRESKTEVDKVYQWIEQLQQDGTNEAAQDAIVKTYKNLVESLARKYSTNELIHEDLTQVGMIGLLAAARRYDKTYGKSFETFAIPTILGEIKRFIRDKTWSVHVPRRIKEMGPKIRKAVDELTTADQQSPTVTNIAEYLHVSEEEVLETMEMGQSYRALSADRKIEADKDGSKVSILDLVGDQEAGYENTDLKLLLEKIFPVLNEREQFILKCIFFENMSQKETGELLGISQMHVSRLQRRSLRRLREELPPESLEELNWM